ncbi:hypothetical protein IW261DRAFT_1503886 [Armillaria novae-zelandiae]|uniref:Uncharacterized protein n=1 Tax=Armillaria novae-zelandiae TaxID=153914 RepID=A0AA39NXE7_9AGAR|nr:hypothetical protein IW261DRAFT_1503886 [Armillaria novae-zelandiae]
MKAVSLVLTAGLDAFSMPILELLSLKYVNDPILQPAFVNSFFPLEDQMKPGQHSGTSFFRSEIVSTPAVLISAAPLTNVFIAKR